METVTLENGNGFTIDNIEIHEKGYLKGYMTSLIAFSNNENNNHEMLYRISDKENGKDNTIVSIDYGYNNPLVDELWNEIENTCLKIVKSI